jgi:TetR/AcrR family transcriptional regulator, copper-responsive repressor
MVVTKGMQMTGRPRLFKEASALDSAMKIFWAHGYEATSYSMLSKAMHMNTPSIYGAFGDKEALFLKVIDQYVEVYGKPAFTIFSEAETCREGFECFLSLKIKEYLNAEHPGCLVTTVLADAAPLSPKFESKLKSLVSALDDLIAKRVQRGIDEGDLPAKTNPKAFARILHNLIIGFAVRARAGESEKALRMLANTTLDVIFSSTR